MNYHHFLTVNSAKSKCVIPDRDYEELLVWSPALVEDMICWDGPMPSGGRTVGVPGLSCPLVVNTEHSNLSVTQLM